MSHFDTPITDINFSINLNILNEKQHHKQLKRAFTDKALPIFLYVLWAFLLVSLFTFFNEKWNIKGQFIQRSKLTKYHMLLGIKPIMIKGQRIWYSLRKKHICLIIAVVILTTLGVTISMVLRPKSQLKSSNFGKFSCN